MGELSWGRRYLMCPPHHFGVLYEINPWMHEEVAVEHDVASQQWQDLVANLRLAGAEVVTMDPQPEVPDLVFTANAGIVNGTQFVPSHFRHPERQGDFQQHHLRSGHGLRAGPAGFDPPALQRRRGGVELSQAKACQK